MGTPQPPSDITQWPFTVDEPVVQDTNYRMNPVDRAYLDSQARGAQQHIVDSLVGGHNDTWATLDQTSAAGAVGDVVCLVGTNVTRAVAAALALAGGPCGVLMTAGAPGMPVRLALTGILPTTVTGLGATIGGRVLARVNQTTARVEAVSTIGGTDYALGTVEASGNLSLRIQLPPNSGGAITPSGDLQPNGSLQTVIGLQTVPMTATPPTDGQSPKYAAASTGYVLTDAKLVTLDSTSASVVAGDVAVSASAASSNKVVRAVTATLANAPTIAGIFLASAAANATSVPIAIAGHVVPNSITGLGAGAAGPVTVNGTTGKLARGSTAPIVGSCDTQGNVTVAPQAVIVSGGNGNQGQFNTTVTAGLNSNLATTGLSLLTLGFGSNAPGAFSLGGFTTTASTKDGLTLTVTNKASQSCTLVEEDASSTAANRISFGRLTNTTAAIVLGPYGGQAQFVYDTQASRWAAISVTRSAWIDALDAGLVTNASATNAAKLNSVFAYAASTAQKTSVRLGGSPLVGGSLAQYFLERPVVLEYPGLTFEGENSQGNTVLRIMYKGPGVINVAPSTQPSLVQDGTFWGLQFGGATNSVIRLNETDRGWLNGQPAHTEEFWIKASAPSGQQAYIIVSNGRRAYSEKTTQALAVGTNATNKVTVAIQTSAGPLNVGGTITLPTGTRTKVAYAFDGLSLKLWVGGTLDGAGSTLSNPTHLAGTVNVLNGSTLVRTTADQSLCIAAGNQLSFGSQAGTAYTIQVQTLSLSGTFTLANDSATVTSTASQVGALFVGQQIRFSQQVRVWYEVQSVTNSTTFVLTKKFTGTGGAGSTAIARCNPGMLPLPGTFGVTVGSPTVTTTQDLSSLVVAGQTIKFSCNGIQYLVSAVTSSTIVLTTNYGAGGSPTAISVPVTGAQMSAFVLTAPYSGTTNTATSAIPQLLGTFDTTGTSPTVIPTTVSQVGVLSVNQQIQFGSQASTWHTITAVGAGNITITPAYTGGSPSSTDVGMASPTLVQSRWEEYVVGGFPLEWPLGPSISSAPVCTLYSLIISDAIARSNPMESVEITTCADDHYQLLCNFDPGNWHASPINALGVPNVLGVVNGSPTVAISPALGAGYAAGQQIQFASDPTNWYSVLTTVAAGATSLTLATNYGGTTNSATSGVVAGSTGLLKTLTRNSALGIVNLPCWYLVRQASVVNQMSGADISGFTIVAGFSGTTAIMGYLCTRMHVHDAVIAVTGGRGVVLDNNCYLSTIRDCDISASDLGRGQCFCVSFSNATGICALTNTRVGGGQYNVVMNNGSATLEDLYPIGGGAGCFFVKGSTLQGTFSMIDCVPGDERGTLDEHDIMLTGLFSMALFSNSELELSVNPNAQAHVVIDAPTGDGNYQFNSTIQGATLIGGKVGSLPAFSFLCPPTRPVKVAGSTQDQLLNTAGVIGPWIDIANPGPVILEDHEEFDRGAINLPSDNDHICTDPNLQMWFHISITSTGALTSTRTVTLPLHMKGKHFKFRNDTTGGQTIKVQMPSGGFVTLAANGSPGYSLDVDDDIVGGVLGLVAA